MSFVWLALTAERIACASCFIWFVIDCLNGLASVGNYLREVWTTSPDNPYTPLVRPCAMIPPEHSSVYHCASDAYSCPWATHVRLFNLNARMGWPQLGLLYAHNDQVICKASWHAMLLYTSCKVMSPPSPLMSSLMTMSWNVFIGNFFFSLHGLFCFWSERWPRGTPRNIFGGGCRAGDSHPSVPHPILRFTIV